jgi:alcohol dehydrogenase class IV
MQFEFSTAGRVIFGPGALARLPEVVAGLGKKALVLTGSSSRFLDRAMKGLESAGVYMEPVRVPGEPTLSFVRATTAICRSARSEFVIGLGGGSAIDAAKAVAALAPATGDVLDYLEGIGEGKQIKFQPLPVIAIPTTAGTGSEVTRNAVLSSPDHRKKVSLRSPMMIPRAALVDPELTLDCPARLTAYAGLDAFSQLLEAYVSPKATPFTDVYCRDGLRFVAASIREAFFTGNDMAARTRMSLASLFGGFALANAGLGAIHGIAAPLGGRFLVPHGAACSALLPAAVEASVKALAEGRGEPRFLERFAQAARMAIGRADAQAADLAPWLRNLCSELKVQTLKQHGVLPEDLEGIATAALEAASIQGNPVQLTIEELVTALAKS